MKRIFKYQIEVTDLQSLILPHNSRILSAKTQNNDAVLYALVDEDEIMRDRYSIIIHGTGHPANDVDNYDFLGTLNMFDGRGMFHVFYKLQ